MIRILGDWLFEHNKPLYRKLKILWHCRIKAPFRWIRAQRCRFFPHDPRMIFASYTDNTSGQALRCRHCGKITAEGPRTPRFPDEKEEGDDGK